MAESTSTFPPPDLKQAAEEVAALLRDRKETIAVAETAAGGLISAALLSTPGASAFYKGGLTVSPELSSVCLSSRVKR
jgi:nicotinamide mononucleotide (NMN) deamidase PncC